MALTAGDTYGGFEILGLLGKGGMGEVYRARDTKLGREVALKVLPDALARDPARLARFEQEARMLASLNHPGIATIFGVDTAGPSPVLVLELVPGETLRDVLKRQRPSMEQALKLAKQIADAVEAAHAKGVIHRDLKPGNIMVTSASETGREGAVKVLDFGLAKAGAPETGQTDLSASPTLSIGATTAGAILGTAAYMSPEQARGEVVDKRADIWAFGCVLYEMLTGQSVFEGPTTSDILAGVLKLNPDWSKLPANLHPRIKLLLERCLEKNAKDRYHSIADVRVDLEKVLADPEGIYAKPRAEAAGMGKLPWMPVAGIALLAGLVGWLIKTVPPPPAPEVLRLFHEIEGTVPTVATLSVSQDGRKVVYVAEEGLRVWSLDSFASILLPGTVGAFLPFFSPDGQQVAYVEGNSPPSGIFKRISVNGGPSGVIVEQINAPLGARWLESGEILYPNNGTGILTVPANGGEPKVLVEESAQVTFPQLLPDGEHILFSLNPFAANQEIVLQNVETGDRRTLVGGRSGTYLQTGEHAGHLVFWSGQPTSQVLALALNEDEGYSPVGSPFPIIDGIEATLIPQVAVSNSGTIAYRAGGEGGAAALGDLEGIRTLTWVTVDGKETPLPAPPDNYRWARVSPSGDRVAVQVGFQIWVWNVRNENFARLPEFGMPMANPIWTPDGERIIFRTGTDEGSALYSIAADGSGEFQHIVDMTPGDSYPWGFTPDESELILTMQAPGGIRAFAVPVGSDWVATGEPRLLRESESQLVEATVAPMGDWMAYTTLMNGATPATYLSPYPDAGRQQIPVGEFAQPRWSPAGDVLYMANAGQGLFAVSVDTTNGIKLGEPELLIPNNYYWGARGRAWDVAPDGRFLLMKNATAGPAPQIVEDATPRIRVVVNWSEELKRLVPLP